MTTPVGNPIRPRPRKSERPGSRQVFSAQSGPSEKLAKKVSAHLEKTWRQPISTHTRDAFVQVESLLASLTCRSIILDSGCGTGTSVRSLAELHPDSVIIGIDQSAKRLERNRAAPLPYLDGRCLWVRAELSSFWRLALEADWRVHKNYLLYPNPWPKATHLGRRWHGHPVFPTLMRLSRETEMRTNWHVYAEEFALASQHVLGFAPKLEVLDVNEPLSPFEAKYRASGHTLYRVLAASKKAPANRGFQSATEVHSS
jgi:tRNA G46 methylase TrmB